MASPATPVTLRAEFGGAPGGTLTLVQRHTPGTATYVAAAPCMMT